MLLLQYPHVHMKPSWPKHFNKKVGTTEEGSRSQEFLFDISGTLNFFFNFFYKLNSKYHSSPSISPIHLTPSPLNQSFKQYPHLTGHPISTRYVTLKIPTFEQQPLSTFTTLHPTTHFIPSTVLLTPRASPNPRHVETNTRPDGHHNTLQHLPRNRRITSSNGAIRPEPKPWKSV